MSKRVLLLGGNFFPEPTGIGKYNGEMIDWLSKNGYTCKVITTFPYYPYWKIQSPYCRRCFWYKTEVRQIDETAKAINIIRCPHYVPKNPSGLKRIISDFSFFFTSYIYVLTLLFSKKYDYIIAVAPPFQLGILAILYKKMKGSKFIYHIQDLQIDAASELQMIKSPIVIKFLFSIEKLILKKADTVSTISAGMLKKVRLKFERNIILYPNWVDINRFRPLMNQEKLKEKFGFQQTDKIILYSGAIGEKQGLDAIIRAAKDFTDHKNVKFLICGSGPYKDKLISLVDQLQLRNVIFYPLQPIDKFNEFLNIADVHLVLQKGNASDLVMPSKLTTILAVGGLAIVTANEGTSLYEIVAKSNLAILVIPDNQEALNTAILTALNANTEEVKCNARTFAKKNLSIDSILSGFSVNVLGNEKTVADNPVQISSLNEPQIADK